MITKWFLFKLPKFVGLYVYENFEYPKLPTFKCVKEAKK